MQEVRRKEEAIQVRANVHGSSVQADPVAVRHGSFDAERRIDRPLLVQIPDSSVLACHDPAGGRPLDSHEELQQGRLPRPVGPDDSDPIPCAEAVRKAFDQHPIAVAKA